MQDEFYLQRKCCKTNKRTLKENGNKPNINNLDFMRIWDIPTEKLCRNHLLGEHSELHAIWLIITQDKKGYFHHPEVNRWKGKLKALYLKHDEIANEMKTRGYKHNSPLNIVFAIGKDKQDELINSVDEQIKILGNKKCGRKL